MSNSEYQVWCDNLLREIAKCGIAEDVANAHMKIEPELYEEWFEDGMLPNQAAEFAANILR